MKGERNPMYGLHHSEEHKEYLRSINIGSLNGNYGRKHTDEEREKISKILTGKPLSEEHKQK